MGLKIKNYTQGFKIVSLALDENTKKDLICDNLDFIFINDKSLFLFPEDVNLEIDYELIQELSVRSNYDIYEIWPDGRLFLRFDTTSIDNYFFITGKCNSNCIMCPSPECSRKYGEDIELEKLITFAKHIPSDTSHLTITGGEPFLSGEPIFDFVSLLRDKFPRTEFLFLTNGRIFSIDKYAKLLRKSLPSNSIIAIPIHGSDAEIHDSITQTKGSFEQTVLGIKRLLRYGIRIEVRIVISKMNCTDLDKLSNFIIREMPQIEYISVIAMEMTGNAYKNKERLWISYKEAFSFASEAIKKLISYGIDVKLYNFPLCTVDPSFWMICEKSISPNKVRFGEVCEICDYKKVCGGVFAGTINMEKDELKAII
ncbi:His-Xaa-Ser system radical SAM maturase HxsC [Sporofaciens sp. SGI.106]|uniref:His-Xaa-Ser system radical SAM maturase HxsC n=1 Tax=Sporofaciens sp. SGI.106 TaxID=3420568 RepID=UPI003CFCC5CA